MNNSNENIKESNTTSLIKTTLYKIYDTLVTSILISYLFGINSFEKILEFDFSDLIMGFITYFTFERIWILFIEDIVIKIEKKFNKKR